MLLRKLALTFLILGIALTTGLWQIDSLREAAHLSDGSAGDPAGGDDFWDAYASSPEGAPLPGTARSEAFPSSPELNRSPEHLRPISHVPIA